MPPDDLPDAGFGVYFRPLEETGGDFYDVVQIDDRTFGYFVADVSGHGVGASFLTSALKTLVRQYTGPLFSPLDTMRTINSVLRTVLPTEQYLTACWSRWNQRSSTLSVVSAGHPPLILVRSGGGAEAMETAGDPLGVFGSVVLQQQEARLSPGDRFFLYTDGLIESAREHGADRRPGLAALMARCEENRHVPIALAPQVIVDGLRPGNRRRRPPAPRRGGPPVKFEEVGTGSAREVSARIPASLEALETLCRRSRSLFARRAWTTPNSMWPSCSSARC